VEVRNVAAAADRSRVADGGSVPCAVCSAQNVRAFFELRGVPARTSVIAATRDEALAVPRGDILLACCGNCGFIGNQAFDAGLTEYSGRIEDTQSCSAVYSAYLEELAVHIVESLGIRNRHVVEIGCGKGEFLHLLCRAGGNSGTGFDPAFRADRHPCPDDPAVRFVADRFSERYSGTGADLYVSKMTLEHIADVRGFLGMLRRSIGAGSAPLVLFQVPESGRIFREGRVCDVVYEHCSYFTPESLQAAFRRAGFEVLGTRISYGGQHLAIEARPGTVQDCAERPEWLVSLADGFADLCRTRVRSWSAGIREAVAAGRKIVVWGSGSRSVMFLHLSGAEQCVDGIIDINPNRQGSWQSGTGLPILPPESLVDIRPDLIFVMNPIYLDEIRRLLDGFGLQPELVAV
jgi:hypothetical protein